MGEKIRLFTARDLERLLARYGFVLISQKGSHRKWRNPIHRSAGCRSCSCGKDFAARDTSKYSCQF